MADFVKTISVLATSIVATLTAFSATAQAPSSHSSQSRPAKPIVLTGATIIRPNATDMDNGTIVTKGADIICVGTQTDCAIPADAEIRDMGGQFILPGLVDAHVHLSSTGWLDTRPDSVNAPEIYPYDQTIAALRSDPGRWHRSYLCSGVTAVFDLGGAAWTVTGPQATDTDRSDRAHVVSAGMLLTPLNDANQHFTTGELADEPVFLPFENDADVRAGIARLKEIGAGAVKVWFLAIAEDRREEMEQRLILTGQLARDAGLPLVVHATDLRDAKAALRAGASVLAHSVTDEFVDDEFLDLLDKADATYVPTLLIIENWRKAIASAKFAAPLEVEDPNHCVDEEILARIAKPELLTGATARRSPERVLDRLVAEGRIQAVMMRNLISIRDAGGRIAVGTDAGNPLTMHGPAILRELEMMQAAGMTPREIIAAATTAGAQAMGMQSSFGSIEAGKTADLIVLTDDPRQNVRNFRNLAFVMRNGVLRTQAELRVR